MRTVAGVAAASVAVAVTAFPTPVGADTDVDTDTAARVEHCVVDIGDGTSATAPTPTCFATFAEAMEVVGLPYTDPSQLPDRGLDATARATTDSPVAAASSMTLGVHFDLDNRGGSSITVTGDSCGGGYTNLSAAWTDRLNSTWNGCAVVAFFSGYDKTGSSLTTGYSTVNLDGFRNVANSILYGS